MAQDIVIGGRLHSAATGNTVAGANEILDDAKGKKQNVINQEVDNEIGSDSAAGTIKGRIKNLETAVGSGGSVDERIAETKAEIIGDAAADYNTLGKVEDKIQAEVSRSEGAEEALDAAKANKATTLEGYGITDAYTKSETYNKTEVNGLVDTPHQNYVTVLTYAALIAIDPGSTDTIYRVSNYDGSVPQVDVTKYSEYAWDGTQYVFLCVKSQIDEVFDISVYNNNATYADLAAALGTDGANVPQTLRRGGMSVKFVHSVDNKYVQFRYMSSSIAVADFTNVANWQGVDSKPTNESHNLVESGGVCGALEEVKELSMVYDNHYNINDSGVKKASSAIQLKTGHTYNIKATSEQTISCGSATISIGNVDASGRENLGTLISTSWDGSEKTFTYNASNDETKALFLYFSSVQTKCTITLHVIDVTEIATKNDIDAIVNYDKEYIRKYTIETFDAEDLVEDVILYPDGTEHTLADWAATDYIPCKQYDKISGAICNGVNLPALCFYDSSHNCIGNYHGDTAREQFSTYCMLADCAYVRYNVFPDDILSYSEQSLLIESSGYILDNLNKLELNQEYRVGHSLLGENTFTSLKACTEYIQSNNIHGAKVYVEPETFDLVQEYTQAYLDSITAQSNVGFGLKVGNNTHFVFSEGSKILFNYDGTNDKCVELFSPINIYGSAIIENATIECQNARYCVHEDLPSVVAISDLPQSYILKYINCNMNHKGNTGDVGSPVCIGAGTLRNSLSIIDGGYYQCTNTFPYAIGYHNFNTTTYGDCPSKVIIRNVRVNNAIRFVRAVATSDSIVDVEVCNTVAPNGIINASEPFFNIITWNNITQS